MATPIKPKPLLPKRKIRTDTRQQHQTVRAYGNTSPLGNKLSDSELDLKRTQEEQSQQ